MRTIPSMLIRRWSFGLLCLLVCMRAWGADGVVADFEPASQPLPVSQNVALERSETEAGQGAAFLRIAAPSTQPAGLIRLPMPRDVSVAAHTELSAMFRVGNAAKAIDLRWLALNEQGEPIFQRRFRLPAGQTWVRIDQPLHNWRWSDSRAGDWDEVTELALRIESPAAQLDLDDVRFIGQAKQNDRAMWLLELAFKQRPTRMLSSDGLLVATDSMDGFTDEDLKRLHQDMQRIRAMIRRIFADAVRQTDQLGPVPLLVFATDAGQKEFLDRLGDAWNTVSPAVATQGYTIEDIATSTYRKELGPRRPVYLHEAVHAIVARELRLLNGREVHSPLQEGLANYVQLCVFPKSLDRRTYINNFNKPVDPTGAGFFKPLDVLLTTRATPDRYAQLASVIAYLVEKDEPLLRDVVRGLADGKGIESILRERSSGFSTLQQRWFEWGNKRFAANAPEGAGPFDIPAEFDAAP